MALIGYAVLPNGDVWAYISEINDVSVTVNARNVVMLSCPETVVDVTVDEEKYGAEIRRKDSCVEVFIVRDGKRLCAGTFTRVKGVRTHDKVRDDKIQEPGEVLQVPDPVPAPEWRLVRGRTGVRTVSEDVAEE